MTPAEGHVSREEVMSALASPNKEEKHCQTMGNFVFIYSNNLETYPVLTLSYMYAFKVIRLITEMFSLSENYQDFMASLWQQHFSQQMQLCMFQGHGTESVVN